MNLAELQRKLIAAARTHPPDDRVPYAFEKRVMALLPAQPVLDDHWTLWSRSLWRAAAGCVAVMLLLGAWSVLDSSNKLAANDLSQDFEQTMLVAVDLDADISR
jgi:hypothetical protein